MTDKAHARGPVGMLDTWLWARGLGPAPVRLVLRNEIILTVACAATGLALLAVSAWMLAFALGVGLMAWIFGGWTRFFSISGLGGGFSATFLRAVLLRWGVRLALFCVILYLALAVLRAPALAIILGMACGLAVGLLSFACGMYKNR